MVGCIRGNDVKIPNIFNNMMYFAHHYRLITTEINPITHVVITNLYNCTYFILTRLSYFNCCILIAESHRNSVSRKTRSLYLEQATTLYCSECQWSFRTRRQCNICIVPQVVGTHRSCTDPLGPVL